MSQKKNQKEKTPKFSLGYFKYFYQFIGNHIFTYLFLNFLIGFLDAIGITLFVPLLALATGTEAGGSLGEMQFVIDKMNAYGIVLNLAICLAMMVSVFLVKGFFYYIRIVYFGYIRRLAIRNIRIKLINNFGKLSYEGFTHFDIGRIQSDMTTSVDRIGNAMTFYFYVFQDIIMIFAYLFMAVTLNWQFSILVVIGGYLTNFIYNYINKITKEISKKNVRLSFNFMGNLVQSIQNFKYLKATNYFNILRLKLISNILEGNKLDFRQSKINALSEGLREPLIIIVISAVMLMEYYIFKQGIASMMVGLLMFYRCLGCLVTVQRSWNNFLATSANIESVDDILEDFREFKEPEFSDEITEIDDIEVKNVKVQFDSKVVLQDINFHIPKLSSVAFVGESGAGKTTLANVICGLQFPHLGGVYTNGKNIYETNLDSYRSKIGYITQEPVIFNDTVFNNITFWQPQTPENLEKFHRVLHMVSMYDFVGGLDKKGDAMLGHSGILVSGGQKQRISIARELYKDVDLLIMDEATSALDSETEQHIKQSIDMLQGKFTIVIIAHRLSTIKNVDKIHLLEEGKITGSGNFQELKEKSEKFSRMVAMQEL
ncbi:MAG: ABC transporter ATP-binding protein/permease [Flavobacteriaceae bacterium]|jgi:subfamily B ATP-binding cassette protein MsbA|nr:ABC transporter ATP-binding protein/permease [Flavobacteriaceae bacterium]